MTRAIRLLAIFMALLLVTAACGDSGDEAGTDGTPAATSAGGDDDTSATIGTIGNVPGISDECEALVEVLLGVSQLFLGANADANQLFDSAASNLPSSLDDDIATVRAAAIAYADLLDEFDVDLINDPQSFVNLTEEQQLRLGEATSDFSSPEVEAAFANLEAYGERECADFIPGG